MLDFAIQLYKLGGRSAVKRWFTIPRSQVERVCMKTGASLPTALEERDEAVEEFVEFLESTLLKHYEDPDE